MRNTKWFYGVTAFMAVLLAVLASSTIDYEVSRNLFNPHSIFAEFFNRFGETPAMLGLLIGTAILYGARNRSNRVTSTVGSIISIPFLLLFSFATAIMPFRYAYEHVESGIPKSMMGVTVLLSLVLFIGTLLAIRKIGSDKLRTFRTAGLILLILVVAEMVVINLLKVLWARPRMRSIESIDQFKRWYEIGGPTGDNELKSFPSGHTGNAFVMLAYTMFVPMNKKRAFTYMTIFGLTWGVMVALSRVILGAHFLSDVFVGGYLTVVLFYGLHSFFSKRDKGVTYQYGKEIR